MNLLKKHHKNLKKIKHDILAVDQHLKPSYLWDQFAASAEIVCEIISSFKTNTKADDFIVKNSLHILRADDAVFVVNIPEILAHLDNILSADGPSLAAGVSFINVSGSLKEPEILDPVIIDSLKQEMLLPLKTQLNDIRSEFGTDSPPQIGTISCNDSWNMTALYGVLLGYPVIYYCELSDDNVDANCLSMVPLRVYKVTGKIRSQSTPCCTEFVYPEIYSFSIPDSFSSEFCDRINTWFKDLQSKNARTNVFESLQMNEQVVTSFLVAT